MADELQSLLERIQRDGVEKAERQAADVLAAAQTKADAIVKAAEQRAGEATSRAEQAAAAFESRARTSLEQAARDVILSVGEAISQTLQRLVTRHVREAMTPDTLKQMLVKVVEAYCRAGGQPGAMQVRLSADQQREILDFLMARYAAELRAGLEVKADRGIVAGFQVSVAQEQVRHDFTDEAITEALCQLVRPHLAEIVRDARRKPVEAA